MNSSQDEAYQVKKNDEISIREIILNVLEWWKYLLSKWKLFLLIAFLGGGVGLLASYLIKPKYQARLTFILEDNSSNPLGAYMGIASQFGIDLGGSSTTGLFSGDNIMEFLRSRLIVQKTLLSSIGVAGKRISLADNYLDFNDYREAWKTDPRLSGVHFPVHPEENLTLIQDSILNVLYQRIIKSELKIEKQDPKLSFISVTYSSRDELFSKMFTERLVKEAISFYVDTKTQRTRSSVERLQLQADSLEQSLNKKTYAAAVNQDINLNPAKQAAGVGGELLMRDKMVLQTMYAEVMKNLELSKIAMAQETPVIQIIDPPILPLRRERFGKLKGIVLGAFVACFMVSIFLIARRIFRKIIASAQ